ncbi:MAG TPA: hypothetical protein VF226_04820 [Hyphomicrobiaceae bacterium]
MARPVLLNVRDLSGGVNRTIHPHLLKDNEVINCRNMVFRTGVPEKRGGSQRYNAVSLGSDPVKGIVRFYRSDGTKRLVIGVGTTLKVGDDVNGTFSDIATGLTANREWHFEQWKDLLFATNAVDPLKQYDGTTVTDVAGSPPRAQFIVQHQNRLFLAGDPANPSRLYFSELDDHQAWPASNFIDIETSSGAGDWITGLASSFGDLVIFKHRSTHLLIGDRQENWVRREIFPGIGCVAPRSVTTDGIWTYFLGADGIYRMRGTTLEHLSHKVNLDLLRSGNLSVAAAAVHDNFLWLTTPIESSVDNSEALTFVFDLETKTWTIFSGIRAHAYAVWDGAGDGHEITWGDASQGLVFFGDRGTSDDGQPIDAHFTSKAYDLDSFTVIKAFRRFWIDVHSSGAKWTVSYQIDQSGPGATMDMSSAIIGASGATFWGRAIWGVSRWSTSRIQTFSESFRREDFGASITVTIRNNSSTDSGSIHGFAVEAIPRRVLRRA